MHGLEGLEKIAVKVKISTIVGLLIALTFSGGHLRVNGGGATFIANSTGGLQSLPILGGMLLIVQGF